MVEKKPDGDAVDRRNPFAKIVERSGNCTRKAKEGHSKVNDVNR